MGSIKDMLKQQQQLDMKIAEAKSFGNSCIIMYDHIYEEIEEILVSQGYDVQKEKSYNIISWKK